jgi:hypothetical protein
MLPGKQAQINVPETQPIVIGAYVETYYQKEYVQFHTKTLKSYTPKY